MGTLVGTFERYPPLTHWVKVGQIVSEPSMYSAWTHWVIDPLPPVSLVLAVEHLLSRLGTLPTSLKLWTEGKHCEDLLGDLLFIVARLATTMTICQFCEGANEGSTRVNAHVMLQSNDSR